MLVLLMNDSGPLCFFKCEVALAVNIQGKDYSLAGREKFKAKGFYVHPNNSQAMKIEWKWKWNGELGENYPYKGVRNPNFSIRE